MKSDMTINQMYDELCQYAERENLFIKGRGMENNILYMRVNGGIICNAIFFSEQSREQNGNNPVPDTVNAFKE